MVMRSKNIEELVVLDLKNCGDNHASLLVKSYLSEIKVPHRLNANYEHFDPWSDPSILVCNLLMMGDEPVSFGCVQRRPYFPPGFCRINTRHFLFPKFRNKNLNIHAIGRTDGGVFFGGAIIRHQIALCKEMGFAGVFVSRDRGLKSFQFFMETTVNEHLIDGLPRLKIHTENQFNVCNSPKNESCWHWLGVATFDKSFELEMLLPLPSRKVALK